MTTRERESASCALTPGLIAEAATGAALRQIRVNRARSSWIHRTFGLDADASDGDDKVSILIAEVGDAIGKQ
jgi:hypothetical protein